MKIALKLNNSIYINMASIIKKKFPSQISENRDENIEMRKKHIQSAYWKSTLKKNCNIGYYT